MTIFRPPSYQQCVLISQIARSGGTITYTELRTGAGAYATNVIGALLERAFIEKNANGAFVLSPDGWAIATELLGDRLRAG